MKYKTNIPALLLALLVLITTNGVVLSEHICNTLHSHNYSLFIKNKCKMEDKMPSCCSKKIENKIKCCEHKQLYKKLTIEGFTAKQLQLKPLEKEISIKFLADSFLHFISQISERNYSGIPPPDNIFTIKYLLRPSQATLQIFRC